MRELDRYEPAIRKAQLSVARLVYVRCRYMEVDERRAEIAGVGRPMCGRPARLTTCDNLLSQDRLRTT